MKVSVIEYDERWAKVFEEEQAILHQVLNDTPAEIEHIGSTSVKGLAAKPIVDIMIGLEDFSLAEALVPRMIASGYDYIKEFEDEMPDRRYFTKRSQGADTHHIHLVASAGEFWTRHLLFRNYLRVNSQAREAYAKLKKALAKLEWKAVDEYCEAKTAFIRKTEKEAQEFFLKAKSNQRR